MTSLISTAVVWAAFLLGRRLLGRRRIAGGGPELALILILLNGHILQSQRFQRLTLDDLAQSGIISFESVVRGIILGVALVCLLPELSRFSPRGKLRGRPALAALTIYGAVALISAAYSLSLILSLGKAVELALVITAVWLIATRHRGDVGVRRAIHLIMLLEASVVIAALLGYVTLPDVFTRQTRRTSFLPLPELTSPFIGKGNVLGGTASLVGIYFSFMALYGPRARRSPRMLVAGAGVFVVLLTSSRQGLVVLAVGFLALLLYQHRYGIVAIGTGAVVAAAVWFPPFIDLLARGQDVDEFATFNGRTIRWAAGFELWQQRPLGGFGFLSGRLAEGSGLLHNGFVEILVGLGLLGVIPLCFAMARIGRWSIAHSSWLPSRPIAVVSMGVLAYSIPATGIAAPNSSSIMILLLAAAFSDLVPGQLQDPSRRGQPVRQRLAARGPARRTPQEAAVTGSGRAQR